MNATQKWLIKLIKWQLHCMAIVSPRWAAKKALQIFSTPTRKVKADLSPIFEKAEKIDFQWQGTPISAFRFNKGGKKKIQILHGFESSVVKFEHFIAPLLKQDVEIIAMDAPAHGKSGGKTLNLLQYIQLIHDADIRFGPIDGYIAHSFGGLALALFLETLPNNAHRKAVLIAPATETTTAINLFFDFLQLSPAVRVQFEQQISIRTGKTPEQFSIRRAAGNFQTPLLWVHDQDDLITPISDVKKVTEAGWPHIQFKFTEGLGHRKIYRDAEVTQAAVRFLTQ